MKYFNFFSKIILTAKFKNIVEKAIEAIRNDDRNVLQDLLTEELFNIYCDGTEAKNNYFLRTMINEKGIGEVLFYENKNSSYESIVEHIFYNANPFDGGFTTMNFHWENTDMYEPRQVTFVSDGNGGFRICEYFYSAES